MGQGMKVLPALVLALCLAPAGAPGEPVYVPPPAPDVTPPTVTIERSLLRATTRTARFWFSASEAAQGFQCRLDKGDFKGCGSPRTYRRLKPGRHVFRVKATDVAGNVGAPAVAHFRIPRPSRGRR
ncbi:MAG TPA: hypothetical protein VFS64_01770 [Solirubrobacterales bacterium]|nr:hypothetical protein [Solirubrobacterales bacterium]